MSSAPASGSRVRQLNPGRLAELVLESAADFAIFTTDLSGVITSWNSAAERVMGWIEAEAVGQHASIIFTPEDREQDGCGQEMAEAQTSGRATDERWHLRKDGSRFWGAGSMTRLEDDETGEHLGYCKIVRDRTEQHEAGQQLEASEALLRNVMENNPDSLELLDRDGRLISVNGPGFRLMQNDNLQHISGKQWVSLWPDEERSKAENALDEATAGRVGRFQGFRLTLEGTPKCWDVQVTSVPGSKRQPGLLLACSRDVTELVAAQSALRRSEERLRTALSISTVGVMFWSPDFGLTEVNDAFLRMTGFSREEAVGKTWQELTPPEFHLPSLKARSARVSAAYRRPCPCRIFRKFPMRG